MIKAKSKTEQVLDYLSTKASAPMCAGEIAEAMEGDDFDPSTVAQMVYALRKNGRALVAGVDHRARKLIWPADRRLPEGWRPPGGARDGAAVEDEGEGRSERQPSTPIDNAVRGHVDAQLRPNEERPRIPAQPRPPTPAPSTSGRSAEGPAYDPAEAAFSPSRVAVAGSRLPPIDVILRQRYAEAVEVAEEVLRDYVSGIDDPILHRLLADVERYRETLEMLEEVA